MLVLDQGFGNEKAVKAVNLVWQREAGKQCGEGVWRLWCHRENLDVVLVLCTWVEIQSIEEINGAGC